MDVMAGPTVGNPAPTARGSFCREDFWLANAPCGGPGSMTAEKSVELRMLAAAQKVKREEATLKDY
jgi:hypothetical protein